MEQRLMVFEEVDNGTDPDRPLIYLWEIVGLEGEVVGRYVGKASRGARRPRTHYTRNVNNILAGRPYRKGKPDEFRKIHRTMAEALKAGCKLRLSFLSNIPAGENINAIEQMWQRHFGLR